MEPKQEKQLNFQPGRYNSDDIFQRSVDKRTKEEIKRKIKEPVDQTS